MVTFDAYYDPEHRAPVALSTPAQVDELLDQMVAEAESPNVEVGLVAQLDGKDGDDWSSTLQFGVRAAATMCGFVGYMGKGETSAISDNGATSPEPVAYDYQSHEREVPSNAEIPWPTVRQAVHDYVASGGTRPAGVRWRELSY
ncbi:Imm1 family immunity protein [Amycolatopsis sp. NPDC047767]|uniref:Imm1 family immunity protein n=1 Tax=Amycolatopsis sp. NPDC047767 TaxID=3156765 RepID=UPI0034548B5C